MSKKNVSILLIILTICNNAYSKKVITVGGAQQDIFIRCTKDTNLSSLAGQKIEICNPSEFHSTGGGAINSAIGFKRIGFNTSTFLKLGTDERSSLFIKKLDAEGINIDSIILSEEDGTGVSYIIPSPDRDNCIFVYRGSNLFIQEKEIPEKEISKCSFMYITSLNGESAEILLPLTQIAKKHNVAMAINPGKSQLTSCDPDFLKSISNTDILIINKLESKILMSHLIETDEELKKRITNTTNVPTDMNSPILLRNQLTINGFKFTIKQVFKTLLTLGPKIIIITNGADGVYAATENKIYYHPSIPTDVVSTTGAGDAFGSGFVGTLFKTNKTIQEAISNKTFEKAICYGVLNSASVVNYMDTNKGLLNQEELNVKSKKIGKSLLQTFDL